MTTQRFIEECKNRANSNRLGKIIVEGMEEPITNSDKLQSISIDSGCYVDGNIIGSVYAKCLKANFVTDVVNLSDKSIQTQIGLKYDDGATEYLSMGKYRVERPNNEITANMSQITAYDSLYTKLDQKYVCGINYSKGNIILRDLYVDVCKQLELTPKTTSFLNNTIPIENNPFTNGEKNRTVLQTICKISCSFVDIDVDNDKIDLCWLSQNENPDYTFYKNDYVSVEGGQVICGPINCLIIKNSQIDSENVTKKDDKDIALNGEHSITISEDYILHSEELRQLAITNIWNRVRGMKYVDCKLTTYYGKPFLKLGNKIRIYIDDDNTQYIDTYVLKHIFSYDGSYNSVIESPALTEQEIKSKQDVSLGQALANTQIDVDKQKKRIDALVTEVDENSSKITELELTTDKVQASVSNVENSLIPTATADGTFLHLTDSADAPVVKISVDGKSTQQLKKPKNMYEDSDTLETYDPRVDAGSLDKDVTFDGSFSIRTNNAWHGPYFNLKKMIADNNLKVGDEVTCSVYFMTNFVPINDMEFGIFRAVDSMIRLPYVKASDVSPNTWYRVSATFNLTEFSLTAEKARIETGYYDTSDQYYFGNNRQNYVWFSRPQFEVGKLTDYESGAIVPSQIDAIGYENLIDYDVKENVLIKQSNRTMQIIPKNDLVLKQGYYTISLPDLELTNNKNTFGGGVYCSIKSKNLYNCKDTANVDGLYTVDKNDWIKNSYDNSTGTSTYYQNYWTNKLKLKAYTQQLIILEVQAVEGDGTLFLTSATETIKDQFQNTVRYDFSDLKAGDIKISKVLTVANFADSRYGLRSFIAYNPGQKGSITFRISILEDTSTTEADFKYEKFGEKINESVVGFGFSNTSNSWSFKMPREAKINYFYLYLSTLDNDNATAKFSKVQLTKGDLPHNYIPFGKYGVEIAFNNRNLLPNTQNIKNQISQGIEFNQNSDGTISLTGKSEGNRQSVLYLISKPNFDTPLTLEPGTYYMLPSENNVCPIIGKVRDVERYPSFPGAGKTSFTLATKETYESIYFQVPKGNQTTFKNFIVYPIMSLDELKSKDDYVNYQRVTATIILDEPLRSLPNGVKDELYLRGGIAYVERNVGSYKFTGTEEISVDSTIEGQSLIRYAFDTKQLKNAPARILGDETLCTHFIFDDDFNKNGIYHSLNTDNKLYFDVDVRKLGTVANFKDWLSTNNVELIYPLASMQVEHLGEFETPKTYENISYIFANDDSKPVLHLEYVRNTTISNYVENQLANERELRNDQYAEFLLQSDQIKSTVSQVQNTLDSNYQEIIEKFNGYVPTNDFALLEHSVTNLQTNTYTKTEINTKLTDGSVTKVKTTSLLADDDGLTVDKNDSKTKGNLDADGLTVIDKTGATEAELLFAGYDAELGETVVRTNNIKITRYTDIGSHSRFQDYEDGTGIFNK